MTELSMLHVYEAHKILFDAGINCIVTGEIGLSYHGVDVVTHNVELCIPAANRGLAVTVLAEQVTVYKALPDLFEPDFYHPHKRGAARFQIRATSPPLEIHLVIDSALGLDSSLSGNFESDLTNATAHSELKDLCHGVDDLILSALRWPTLASFLDGWLALAARVKGLEMEIVFLMQAERLIDANDVDIAWFNEHLQSARHYEVAQKLLEGKERRRLGSKWD